MRQRNTKYQRGAALYFAMMLTTILLGISLGMATVFFKQVSLLRDIGDSVFAFFASDAGVERVLMIDNQLCAGETDRIACVISQAPLSPVELSNGATYQVVAERAGTGICGTEVNYCVKSVGLYKDARRAVRITR